MAKTDVQHDVIVIGAGIAGLVAANRAAQLGKRVIVLEKSKEEKYLCNSRYTYGTFHINFTDASKRTRMCCSARSKPAARALRARIWRALSPRTAAG